MVASFANATAAGERLKGKNADYGSDKQKETKSAKVFGTQVRSELIFVLCYLLLENKRFADDRALLIGFFLAFLRQGRV
jgi:hypothetical protein